MYSNHGRGINFFQVPNLNARRRGELKKKDKAKTVDIDSLCYTSAAEQESEWENSLSRGGNYIIKDKESHFALKAKMKNRMLDIARAMSQHGTVCDDLNKMFKLDSKLPYNMRRATIA